MEKKYIGFVLREIFIKSNNKTKQRSDGKRDDKNHQYFIPGFFCDQIT